MNMTRIARPVALAALLFCLPTGPLQAQVLPDFTRLVTENSPALESYFGDKITATYSDPSSASQLETFDVSKEVPVVVGTDGLAQGREALRFHVQHAARRREVVVLGLRAHLHAWIHGFPSGGFSEGSRRWAP